MRLAIDVRHLLRGQHSGVGMYTIELLSRLIPFLQADDIVLFSTGRTRASLPASLFPPGKQVRHIHLPGSNRLRHLRMVLTGTPKLDVQIARAAGWQDTEDILWFFPGFNFIRCTKGTRYVLTIHDLAYTLFPEHSTWWSRLWHRVVSPPRLAKEAAAILVPSEHTKQDVIRLFGITPNQIHITPLGVDTRFTHHRQAHDHGVRSLYKLPSQFILMLGDQDLRKNVRGGTTAVARARTKMHKDLHLVLVGKGRAPESLPPWVHVLGYVKQEHLPSLYRLAEIFLFPSFYEGFGLPVLEAMASGTPVITSHSSCLPEVAEDTAVVINPFRIEEITQALEILLDDEALREKLIARGLRRASQFRWKYTAEQTANIFHMLSS